MLQHLLDTAPQADRYFSDAFPTYGRLIYYPGRHQAMGDKSQTYSVEADNILRHSMNALLPMRPTGSLRSLNGTIHPSTVVGSISSSASYLFFVGSA